MERTSQMENIKNINYLKNLRSTGKYSKEVCELVEADIEFGLSEEQTKLYLKKNFKLAQMQVLSGCLRKGLDMFTGSTAIPVYYQMPVVDANGKIVQRVPVERSMRKSETGVAALIGKLGFKKKSRQDIVKLVAAGNLVPEQLIQIKSGIERGLTEGQLVELINNNVSAEKMKEIIEIAVLENSMDY